MRRNLVPAVVFGLLAVAACVAVEISWRVVDLGWVIAEHARRVQDDRPYVNATRSWIADNAIRFRTVEPGHGFDDLQPLRDIVRDARIVSLGEATHGTREFQQLKHRILEFLVSEMGFNLFGIEAAMPECFALNRYVLSGSGDPSKALAGIYYWVWDTKEMLDQIEWMRRYNADPQHTRKVKFYGFDVAFAARAAKTTLAYLQRVDPEEAAVAEPALQVVANPFTTSQPDTIQGQKRLTAGRAIGRVLAQLDERKTEYVQAAGAEEWDLARLHARIVARNIEEFRSTEMNAVRDPAMAENVRWILDREGPDSKIVLSAHNNHVGANTDPVPSMGLHLRRVFGPSMVVFGFSFNSGEFRAVELGSGVQTVRVVPAPRDTLEAMLASAGLRYAAIDLRRIPKQGPVAKWFGENRPSRWVGCCYSPVYDSVFIPSSISPRIYDAILFVRDTHATTPIDPDELRTAPRGSAVFNGGFELGQPNMPPPGWRSHPVLVRCDFRVSTTGEAPFDGKRSAVIRRLPGERYGEFAGSFGQGLDATSYRGKTIVLRAAARADIPGPPDGSWLFLRVAREGRFSSAAETDDQLPVLSRDWRVYELRAYVPSDAVSIFYGLVLAGEGAAWLDAVSVEPAASSRPR